MSVEVALPTCIVPYQLFALMLPAIEAYTRNQFQHLTSSHDREDAEAEVVAWVWERFVAMPTAFDVAAGETASA